MLKRYFSSQRPTHILLAGSIVLISIAFLFPHSFSHSSGYWDSYTQTVSYLLTEGTFGPELYLAPGFPGMLSIIALVLPLSPFVVRLMQVVFVLLLLRIAFLIGKEVLHDELIGYIGVFLMLWPALTLQIFSFDALLFYTLLLLSGILFILRAHMRHSRMYMAFAGLSFGYAALTDPIGIYVPVIVLFWFLYVSWKSIPMTKILSLIAVFVFSFALLIAPWYVRNVVTFEDSRDVPIVQKRVEKEVFVDPQTRFIILDFFANHPKQALQKAAYMVFIPPDLASLDQNTALHYRDALVSLLRTGTLPPQVPMALFLAKSLIAAAHVFVILLAIVGAFLSRSKPLAILAALLLAYVFFAVIGVGSLTQFRGISPLQEFVYPLYPLFYLLAGYTLIALYNYLKGLAHRNS